LETTPSECHAGGLFLAKVSEGLPSPLSKGFGEEAFLNSSNSPEGVKKSIFMEASGDIEKVLGRYLFMSNY
jgi:hypothetical protein